MAVVAPVPQPVGDPSHQAEVEVVPALSPPFSAEEEAALMLHVCSGLQEAPVLLAAGTGAA